MKKILSNPKTPLVLLICLFAFIYILATVKVVRKAKKNRTAFLRWGSYSKKLDKGEMIYHRFIYKDPKIKDFPDHVIEGYPCLPMMLLILKPFYSLGNIGGSLAWMTLKFIIIVFIFWVTVQVTRNHGPPWSLWALCLVLLLSIRVFLGDLTHGNVNIFIGGFIAGALLCTYYSRDFSAGFLIGCAAILKVTPGLFGVYYLYKRRWKSLMGVAVGLFLFMLIPTCILGVEYNKNLTIGWYKQMIAPFIHGKVIAYNSHTEYLNQSLTGVSYRLLTDSQASKKTRKKPQLKVNLLSLQHKTVGSILKTIYLILLIILYIFTRTPDDKRMSLATIGEFAIVFLAMLFISERTWKHHCILLIFAHSFLIYYVFLVLQQDKKPKLTIYCLGVSFLFHFLLSSFTLGDYGSLLLLSYGGHFIGNLALFIGCCYVLQQLRKADYITAIE